MQSVDGQRAEYFPWEEHPYYLLYQKLEENMTPESTVLDIGCGRKADTLSGFKGKAGKLIGIDVDDFTNDDPDLNLIQESATAMPSVADNSIDLAYSASLMEHIEDIDAALREIWRVLKTGGKYVWLAPNLYHYAYAISAIVPNALHPIIVNFSHGRSKHDVFPAYYKANTRKAIYKLADQHDLQIEHFAYLGSEPHYLTFNRYAYRLGTWFEFLLRKHERLHWQLGWVFCVMVKPDQA